MKLLYSNILPLKTQDGKQTFIHRFTTAVKQSDRLEIAVGYVSKASLQELGDLVNEYRINNICLTIGMYYLEGMPEGTYNAALTLNEEWQSKKIGEVRLVRSLKYHGKLYVFYKDTKPFEGYVGSHNLGAIKTEANNIRQYEISAVTDQPEEVQEIADFIEELKAKNCSDNIASLKDINLIRELNRALVDQEFVSKITDDEVSAYKKHLTDISFELPLKVPQDKNDPNMRGSNINVCYAKGRKRVWWEIEMVIGKAIRDLPGYPEYQHPFMCVTDDGWKFQVWTCGSTNKNLYSKDDLKILGRWLKGRLVAAGLVDAVNNVEADTEAKGVITEEILRKYGRNTITLTKTTLTTTLADGTVENVWMLSFLPESQSEEDITE